MGQIRVVRVADRRPRTAPPRRCRPPAGELTLHTDPEDAAALALYDDAGAYRPLKTAPNLRHGWRLSCPTRRRCGWRWTCFIRRGWGRGRRSSRDGWRRRRCARRSAGRRACTASPRKLTDEQADALVGRFCRSDGGCLRTILWRRDAAGTVPSSQLPPEKFDPAYDQTTGKAGGERIRPAALSGSVQPARGRGARGREGRAPLGRWIEDRGSRKRANAARETDCSPLLRPLLISAYLPHAPPRPPLS